MVLPGLLLIGIAVPMAAIAIAFHRRRANPRRVLALGYTAILLLFVGCMILVERQRGQDGLRTFNLYAAPLAALLFLANGWREYSRSAYRSAILYFAAGIGFLFIVFGIL
jgi:uncharacterized membrane protein YfcA